MITTKATPRLNGEANKLLVGDRPVHDWYRFVLSYPPHLVREYLQQFGVTYKKLVLDPFCGTGTTLVECKKMGVPSVGTEANPMAHLACKVKTDWAPDPVALYKSAQRIADQAIERLQVEGFEDEPMPRNLSLVAQCRSLPAEVVKLILSESISALPLHKTLVLRDCIERARSHAKGHFQVALAKAIVFSISNLRSEERRVGKECRL